MPMFFFISKLLCDTPESPPLKIVESFDMKKNMGIGLSVCYTIVKAHDGTMTAENLDSGGACFRFYLPLEEGINSEIEG